MSEPHTFKDLVVWQRAIDLIPEIYRAIQKFPDFERFALADQVRRAVVSVSSNIAEGQGRQTAKEFAHFLTIARGSLSEVESLLNAAHRLNYISQSQLTELSDAIHSVRRPLHGLIEKFRPAPPTSKQNRSAYRVPNRTRTANIPNHPGT